jgi:hypothetical protein
MSGSYSYFFHVIHVKRPSGSIEPVLRLKTLECFQTFNNIKGVKSNTQPLAD